MKSVFFQICNCQKADKYSVFVMICLELQTKFDFECLARLVLSGVQLVVLSGVAWNCLELHTEFDSIIWRRYGASGVELVVLSGVVWNCLELQTQFDSIYLAKI